MTSQPSTSSLGPPSATNALRHPLPRSGSSGSFVHTPSTAHSTSTAGWSEVPLTPAEGAAMPIAAGLGSQTKSTETISGTGNGLEGNDDWTDEYLGLGMMERLTL